MFMANYRSTGGLTITQLESMLYSRRAQIENLTRQRNRVLKQLATIDDKIKKLGGTLRGGAGTPSLTAGGRARNAKSLVGTMEEVLTKAGKPLSVGEIVEAVEASGYRSNSDNFRAIVNQTLIKERKHFTNAARGVYGIKK